MKSFLGHSRKELQVEAAFVPRAYFVVLAHRGTLAGGGLEPGVFAADRLLRQLALSQGLRLGVRARTHRGGSYRLSEAYLVISWPACELSPLPLRRG